jgi:hypothetical protein
VVHAHVRRPHERAPAPEEPQDELGLVRRLRLGPVAERRVESAGVNEDLATERHVAARPDVPRRRLRTSEDAVLASVEAAIGCPGLVGRRDGPEDAVGKGRAVERGQQPLCPALVYDLVVVDEADQPRSGRGEPSVPRVAKASREDVEVPDVSARRGRRLGAFPGDDDLELRVGEGGRSTKRLDCQVEPGGSKGAYDY